MVNATFTVHLPGYLHPLFLACRCGIYHLCHIFTLQYLHICDQFARSKFVQIQFFVSVENVAILSLPKTSLGVRLSRIHFSEGEK